MADLKRGLSKITEHNGQAPPGLAGTVESTHASLGRQSLIMTQGHPDPKDEEATQPQKGAGPGNGAGPFSCCSIKTEDGPPQLLSICISSICETSANGTSFPQSRPQISGKESTWSKLDWFSYSGLTCSGQRWVKQQESGFWEVGVKGVIMSWTDAPNDPRLCASSGDADWNPESLLLSSHGDGGQRHTHT